MSDAVTAFKGRKHRELSQAVLNHGALSAMGIQERVFARLFSGLVYAQIWEDPEVDMKAMDLSPGHRVVAIASGGCNVMSYLSRGPARIDAVDLNHAHVALNRLKIAAVTHLPSYRDFFRFFAATGQRQNTAAYDRFLAPVLDDATRRYWGTRTLNGRRRIAAFNGNFHRRGLLGSFIRISHFLARLHGVDPAGLLATANPREQRRFFDSEIAPLFDKPLIRFLVARRASLFGLGIPPAQYSELSGPAGVRAMSEVLRKRTEKLACDFPAGDNYFAWQAFGRRYDCAGDAALPPYLQAANYTAIRQNADRLHIHHCNLTALLAKRPAGSLDRYVLLDAQDWMDGAKLNALWTEITRTAAPGARVIFRTAGTASNLPANLSSSLLDQWHYDEEASAEGLRNDRSAIYGGFHVYILNARPQ